MTSYQAIATGEPAAVTSEVKRPTGREPGTLSAYVSAHPESLAHVVSPR